MMKLNSKPGNVSKIEPFVENLVSRYKIQPDKQCNILISLTEAVTNAIVHGNKRDVSKLVKVKHQRRRDCLAVQVSDEGKGFDFNSLPDPTSPENLLKIGGRGVFLIRQLSDRVRFFDNGSTVEMQFRL